MRPLIEKISPDVGSSFHIQKYVTKHECIMNYWHHHPEYELVYVHKDKGELCIGNYLSHFQDGVLLFIGPNIPHHPFLTSADDDNFEIVLQLKEDFMGEGFFEKPEMGQIKRLFERAKQGIIFGQKTKEKSQKKLLKILAAPPFKRLVLLLDFLNDLTESSQYQIINTNAAALAIGTGDFNRMRHVYELVAERYMDDISLQEVAELTNLTIPSFCRLFKRLTSKTFTQFLNEYRVTKALQLLNTEDCSISSVAFDSGFKSLSYFNRQFKEITGHKPSDYKKAYKQLIVN